MSWGCSANRKIILQWQKKQYSIPKLCIIFLNRYRNSHELTEANLLWWKNCHLMSRKISKCSGFCSFKILFFLIHRICFPTIVSIVCLSMYVSSVNNLTSASIQENRMQRSYRWANRSAKYALSWLHIYTEIPQKVSFNTTFACITCQFCWQ